MSPLWGFKIFFYPMFYKHAAPLGLNAAMHQNSRWDIHRRGGVPLPNGLGDPTPTDSTSLCHLPIFPYPGGTCRPSGALGYLVYAVFYKHAAPLGLNDPLPRSPAPPLPRFLVFSLRVLCASAVFLSRFNQNSSYFNNRHSIGPLYNVNRFAVRSPIDFANFRLPVNRYAV